MRTRELFCLLIAVLAITLSGCTGSAPVNSSSDTGTTLPPQDMYRDASLIANSYHYYADADFNNGTAAWDLENYRQAIADYANASLEYDEAAQYYQTMISYASSDSESEYATLMQGCAMNMSKSADAFMESAISLTAGDMDNAAGKFDDGQAYAYESSMLLDRSLEVTPEWMQNLSSG